MYNYVLYLLFSITVSIYIQCVCVFNSIRQWPAVALRLGSRETCPTASRLPNPLVFLADVISTELKSYWSQQGSHGIPTKGWLVVSDPLKNISQLG